MLSILFEDNYILAVNKPAGLQAETGHGAYPSVESEVSAYLRKTFPWKKQLITGMVHRLDRQVSGVMILAKTPMALKSLNLQFEQRTVSKKYLALVEGKMPEATGYLLDWMRKDSNEKRAIPASKNDPLAQECRLLYEVLEEGSGKSLVEVELLTGRYHQIRLQLSAVGCPILGDDKYGSSLHSRDMIYLHARTITVEHPKTREKMKFEAPLPETGFWKKNDTASLLSYYPDR